MAGGKNERRETKREETEKHYIENEGGKTGMRGRTFRKITKSLHDHTQVDSETCTKVKTQTPHRPESLMA